MTATQTLTDQQRYRLQLRLSARHRRWCSNVPATDLDSDGQRILEGLFIEYDNQRPVALLDYKSGGWDVDANVRTLADLGRRSDLPTYVVQYRDAGDVPWSWVFRVTRVTRLDLGAGLAQVTAGDAITLDERGYVAWLHWLRGRTCCTPRPARPPQTRPRHQRTGEPT